MRLLRLGEGLRVWQPRRLAWARQVQIMVWRLVHFQDTAQLCGMWIGCLLDVACAAHRRSGMCLAWTGWVRKWHISAMMPVQEAFLAVLGEDCCSMAALTHGRRARDALETASAVPSVLKVTSWCRMGACQYGGAHPTSLHTPCWGCTSWSPRLPGSITMPPSPSSVQQPLHGCALPRCSARQQHPLKILMMREH